MYAVVVSYTNSPDSIRQLHPSREVAEAELRHLERWYQHQFGLRVEEDGTLRRIDNQHVIGKLELKEILN